MSAYSEQLREALGAAETAGAQTAQHARRVRHDPRHHDQPPIPSTRIATAPVNPAHRVVGTRTSGTPPVRPTGPSQAEQRLTRLEAEMATLSAKVGESIAQIANLSVRVTESVAEMVALSAKVSESVAEMAKVARVAEDLSAIGEGVLWIVERERRKSATATEQATLTNAEQTAPAILEDVYATGILTREALAASEPKMEAVLSFVNRQLAARRTDLKSAITGKVYDSSNKKAVNKLELKFFAEAIFKPGPHTDPTVLQMRRAAMLCLALAHPDQRYFASRLERDPTSNTRNFWPRMSQAIIKIDKYPPEEREKEYNRIIERDRMKYPINKLGDNDSELEDFAETRNDGLRYAPRTRRGDPHDDTLAPDRKRPRLAGPAHEMMDPSGGVSGGHDAEAAEAAAVAALEDEFWNGTGGDGGREGDQDAEGDDMSLLDEEEVLDEEPVEAVAVGMGRGIRTVHEGYGRERIGGVMRGRAPPGLGAGGARLG
ncbi:hypothetical protein BDK51DRAFT_34907 [Blyttiomyces helicus]|uniref:Uncharacterized protein n=1 Tax=Blyttiomyces helicus TaxID=388810 RepID=A0A4P9WJT4_9FUNG|nr:hypothetical protein BDK51DRAFT_34907 [Blyttiomyces helicus]|eukprot:RKO91400.1 hypothetical protein BDK51DRAFT_34907 [Blyttiomyces helicus]